MKVQIEPTVQLATPPPILSLTTTETVNDLKEKIENLLGIKKAKQVLRVKGRILNSKIMNLILVG